MIERAEKPSAHIEVIPARPEQEPILANLLELYAHDFSEFHDLELGADGRFGYRSLSLYWTEPGRHPFLVRVDGKLAGLVLVKRGSEFSGNQTVWDVSENTSVKTRHTASLCHAYSICRRAMQHAKLTRMAQFGAHRLVRCSCVNEIFACVSGHRVTNFPCFRCAAYRPPASGAQI